MPEAGRFAKSWLYEEAVKPAEPQAWKYDEKNDEWAVACKDSALVNGIARAKVECEALMDWVGTGSPGSRTLDETKFKNLDYTSSSMRTLFELLTKAFNAAQRAIGRYSTWFDEQTAAEYVKSVGSGCSFYGSRSRAIGRAAAGDE